MHGGQLGGLRTAIARTLVAGTVAGFVVGAPQAAFADPADEGSWGPLQQYPVVPVSMGVMPDGRIVAWDQANKPPNFPNIPNNGAAMVLDPQTGQITRSANLAPRTTFCSLIAALPDGRLAVIGGGSDSGNGATRDVQIYDADSKTFSVLGQMSERRWYPGGTIDREGNPVVAGGTSNGIEEMNQLTGASTTLNTTFPTNWYPDLIRTQPGNFLIEDVGDNATAGPGRYLLSGTSLTSVSDGSLLEARRRGIRTTIGPYTMFYNSGGTSKASMIINASSGTPTYTQAAPSRLHHMTGQAVTLPTGDVLAVGGNSSGHDTKGTPVMTPELYSVDTNSWTDMADLARRRTYHSVAALLPDGRVWSAGSSFDEVQEPNGQFFSPPYLYQSDGQLAPRPTATGAPASVSAGQTFSISTTTPNDVAYASVIRLAATTHQLNAGQAFVQVPVTAGTGQVELRAPTVDEAPPGYYMVFLVNDDGVPSVAPVIRLYPSGSSVPPPRVVQSSQNDVSSQAWNAFDGDTSQSPGSKVSQTLDESQPWWQVDLGLSKDLDSVTVRLRADCCTDRNRDLWVFASDVPFQSTSVDGLRAQPGVTAVRLQTPEGDVNVAPLDRTARYIRVQNPGSGFLDLAEVTPNVSGEPSPPLARQSTTNVSNGVSRGAGRALDGNTNGNLSAGYASETRTENEPWWQVDLGRERDLGNVRVNMRTDCCTDQTRDLWVFSSKTPFTSNTVAGTLAEPGVSAVRMQTPTGTVGDAAINATGRYVRIQVPAQNTSLALAEVELIDNQRPTVAVTSPGAGATFNAPASFAFSATAADPDGQVTKVEFFRGLTLVGTDTNAPFSVTASGVPAGSHTLTARATDSGGAVTTSAPVAITVQQPPPSEPIAAPPPIAAPQTGPQPVLELSFGEGSGGVASDTSGKGHHGSISGASWTTQGHSGPALSFDGVNDGVTVADHGDLDLGDTFTLESWIMPRTLDGWRMTILKEAPPNTLSYALYASAEGGPIPNGWTTGDGVVSPRTLPEGVWSHLATTYDRGTMRIYVNRKLVATKTGVPAPPATSGPLRIGANTIWDFEAFDGLIDDVRIYREALAPGQLASGQRFAAAKLGKRLKPGCVAKAKWVTGGKVKHATCKRKKRR